MSIYAPYQVRLWRKHLLQHQAILDLALPEMGLQGGESAVEERLLSALLQGLGVPVRLRAETQRRYGNEKRRESIRKGEIARASQDVGSFYVAASRFIALFEEAVREAGVAGEPAFEQGREKVFFQTLFDLGLYYNIIGQEAMEDAVKLYDKGKGNFDRSAPTLPPDGPLWHPGDPPSLELNLEAFAHARRALQAIGHTELGSVSAVQAAAPMARFLIHRFRGLVVSVLGLPADLPWVLGFFQGTRLVDRTIAAQLEALINSSTPPDLSELSPDIAGMVQETTRRLAMAADGIEQAWRDGVFDPEEVLLLRYSLLHLFGLSEELSARFIGVKDRAQRLVASLRGVPIEGEALAISNHDMLSVGILDDPGPEIDIPESDV